MSLENKTEIEDIRKGINKALRYVRYELIIENIPLTQPIAQAYCPVHKDSYFMRIGETNRFYCAHADHFGRSLNPDFRSDPFITDTPRQR